MVLDIPHAPSHTLLCLAQSVCHSLPLCTRWGRSDTSRSPIKVSARLALPPPPLLSTHCCPAVRDAFRLPLLSGGVLRSPRPPAPHVSCGPLPVTTRYLSHRPLQVPKKKLRGLGRGKGLSETQPPRILPKPHLPPSLRTGRSHYKQNAGSDSLCTRQ